MKIISQTFVSGKIWRKVKNMPPWQQRTLLAASNTVWSLMQISACLVIIPCLCVGHFAGPSVAVNRNAESNFFFDFAICWTEEVRTANFDNIGATFGWSGADSIQFWLNYGWLFQVLTLSTAQPKTCLPKLPLLATLLCRHMRLIFKFAELSWAAAGVGCSLYCTAALVAPQWPAEGPGVKSWEISTFAPLFKASSQTGRSKHFTRSLKIVGVLRINNIRFCLHCRLPWFSCQFYEVLNWGIQNLDATTQRSGM